MKRKHETTEESSSTSEVKFNTLKHEEWISNLPDNIIQHILSFLSTEDAVRTSVLSRGWRSKWMSITNLDLLKSAPKSVYKPEEATFHGFLERKHLCVALKHNAQHWVFTFHQIAEEKTEFHNEFMNLEKAFSMAGTLLKLPSSIAYSNLKVLTLRCVALEGNSSIIQPLFYDLFVLEELTLDRCSWSNFEVFVMNLPMLQKLVINENVADPYYDYGTMIYIVAENLRTFYFSGTLRNITYSLPKNTCLSLGCVSMGLLVPEDRSRKQNMDVAFRATFLLSAICTMRELTLTPYAFEVLTNSEYFFVQPLVFHNLTSLGFHHLGAPINFGCKRLTSFFERFPRLESLIFASGICLSRNHEEERNRILEPVPDCFSSHLKIIKICQFCGTDGELQIVKSLLENARLLLQLDIECDREKFSGSYDQILRLPRASIDCVINFS